MLRMEKFDKNFLFAMQNENHHQFFFFVAHNFFGVECLLRLSFQLLCIGSLFLCFFSVRFCWFHVRKLFEIHKSFMHIHHVLKLMNHLRGFPMMNGQCCIGNNNDVSLFISAFFPSLDSVCFFFCLAFHRYCFEFFIICLHVRSLYPIRTFYVCVLGFHNLLIYFVCVLKQKCGAFHSNPSLLMYLYLRTFIFISDILFSNNFFGFDAYKRVEIGCNQLTASSLYHIFKIKCPSFFPWLIFDANQSKLWSNNHCIIFHIQNISYPLGNNSIIIIIEFFSFWNTANFTLNGVPQLITIKIQSKYQI